VVAANAGSSTTRRWKGNTVGSPAISNSEEGSLGPLEGVLPGVPGDNQFGKERVESSGDDVTGGDTGVNPDPWASGEAKGVDGSWHGHEIHAGVFAVDAELNGVPVGFGVGVVD
jgi:hypothetical protein